MNKPSIPFMERAELRLYRSIGFFLAFLLCYFSSVLASDSHYGNFELEAEQHWETYGVGGTCIPGTHSLCISNVDSDAYLEMITGGFMYCHTNNSRTTFQAPLKIWAWDGQNIVSKANASWNGNVVCLFASDVDDDGFVEIITAGSVVNGNIFSSSLRVWHYVNDILELKSEYTGVSVSSIFVSDLNGDGLKEILTIGRLYKELVSTSQLCLWHYVDNNLTLVDTIDLTIAEVKSASSVYANDLDSNGVIEIIVAGYSGELSDSKGQLCVFNWNGQDFSLEANEKWQLISGVCATTIAGQVQGNTIVNNVKASDVNDDGFNEIVTGGFTFDGVNVNGQLKVWGWNGDKLSQIFSEEWTTDYLTEVKCLTLNDVNGDKKIEIVGSGMVASRDSFANESAVHDRGQLKVWGWSGSTFTAMQSIDWSIHDGACAWNVASGDVDKDEVTEIVTVGCIGLGTLCDPDMRIWSIPQAESFPYYFLIPVIVIVSLLIIGSLVYMRRK